MSNPPTVENGWTGLIHYKLSDDQTYCNRVIREDWRTVDGFVDCTNCLKVHHALQLKALEHAQALAADLSRDTGKRYIVKDDDGHPLIVSAEPTCYELLEECRTVLRAMISAPTLARNAVPNAERMIERLDAALGGK